MGGKELQKKIKVIIIMEEKKKMLYSISNLEKFYVAINPNITTVNKDVLYFNASGQDNAYTEKLIDLYLNASSTHSNFINLKRNLLYGDGLEPSTPTPEYINFTERLNKSGDNLNDVFLKSCLDMSIYEMIYWQIVYDSENKIVAIYHVDPNDVRATVSDEYGRTPAFYISKNWGDISNKLNKRSSVKNKSIKVNAFDPNNGTEDGVQLLQIKRYVSGNNAYSTPMYNSALNWIQLDNELGKFELNKVANGFFPSALLYLTGDPDEEQKSKFVNDFTRKMMGSEGQKLTFIWGTNSDEKPEFVRLEADKNDTLFNELNQIAAQKIATAHGGNLDLAGIEGKGADLGGDANKLNTSLAWYQKTVIRPMQEVMLSGINKILGVNGLVEVEIGFTPLTVETGEEPDEEMITKAKIIKELNIE